jgi:hypothetical protein
MPPDRPGLCRELGSSRSPRFPVRLFDWRGALMVFRTGFQENLSLSASVTKMVFNDCEALRESDIVVFQFGNDDRDTEKH